MKILHFTFFNFFLCFPIFSQSVLPKIKINNFPNLLEVTSTEIGYSLVEKSSNEFYEGYELLKPIEIIFLGGKYSISPSDLYLFDSDKKFNYYLCKNECVNWYNNFSNSVKNSFKGGVKIHKKNIYKSMFYYLPVSNNISIKKVFGPNFNVETTLKPKEIVIEKNLGYKQEFIYNGKIGNSLKFIYREFVDDFARPSFNQEVQYDLNESNIIGFKGLKIEVLKATNSKIEFKVLAHFPEK